MCLIVRNFVDSELDKNDIYDFYFHSPDSMGIMWVEDRQVKVVKSLPKDEKAAWRLYARHAQGRDCVVHFRQRTSGAVDMENCHPIRITRDCWMMHNGILPIGGASGRSDTWRYAKEVLRPIFSQWPQALKCMAFREMIKRDIGHGNRLIIASARLGYVEIGMPNIWYKGAKLSNYYAWSSSICGTLVERHERDCPDYWLIDNGNSIVDVDDVCNEKDEKKRWAWLSKYL